MANKSSTKGRASDQQQRPKQKQAKQPGRQEPMAPQPVTLPEDVGRPKRLEGMSAVITGGDSGIGRSVAVAFAREGANVAIVYLEEQQDAEETKRQVEAEGQSCLLIKGDITREKFCQRAVKQAAEKLGGIDVLVNNAGVQFPQKSIEDIDEKQLTETFRTNIFSMFFLAKAALPFLRKSGHPSIINTTSVTAYRGSPGLLDYSSTKGAIVSFTRSLSQNLAKEGIRVNAVAPGPIWTPLIPASFGEEKVAKFGGDVPLGRAGQPWECATCYVFLAAKDGSYITGQVLHPNGGEIING